MRRTTWADRMDRRPQRDREQLPAGTWGRQLRAARNFRDWCEREGINSHDAPTAEIVAVRFDPDEVSKLWIKLSDGVSMHTGPGIACSIESMRENCLPSMFVPPPGVHTDDDLAAWLAAEATPMHKPGA